MSMAEEAARSLTVRYDFPFSVLTRSVITEETSITVPDYARKE